MRAALTVTTVAPEMEKVDGSLNVSIFVSLRNWLNTVRRLRDQNFAWLGAKKGKGRMKKLIAMYLLAIMVAVLLAGCAEEVSREPIDVRYTEAFDGVETDYKYKFSVLHGGFALVPVVETVHHEAKWEIRYLVTYDNGRKKTEWRECAESEYNLVKERLTSGGEN